MAKCKYCGAEIKWIRTVSGKSMPCDPGPISYRAGGSEKIVTPDGEVIACTICRRGEAADGIGYVPHWATCAGGID